MKAIREGKGLSILSKYQLPTVKLKVWNIIKTETNGKSKTRYCNFNNIITHFRLYIFKLFTILKLSDQSTNTLAIRIQYS